MMTLLKIIIAFFMVSRVFSAELLYDVYGIQKFTTFELGENRKFLTYNNESIVLSNLGVNGVNECRGVIEVINGKSSSNLMCRYVEENGDYNFVLSCLKSKCRLYDTRFFGEKKNEYRTSRGRDLLN